MAVLVHFDADAGWGETHVCDGRISHSLEQAGVAWGRWDVPESHASLRAAAQDAFGAVASAQEGVEAAATGRLRLLPDDAAWPALRPALQAERVASAAQLHGVAQGTCLFYIRTGDGFVGLLCEAGEWVALPAGTQHAFDAGTEPDLDLLQWTGDAARPTHAAWPALPSMDDFVEEMLQLTGHCEAAEE
jgi:1,2-dihydroxy-3-keto-5-methylthiopentene dioxygenase